MVSPSVMSPCRLGLGACSRSHDRGWVRLLFRPEGMTSIEGRLSLRRELPYPRSHRPR